MAIGVWGHHFPPTIETYKSHLSSTCWSVGASKALLIARGDGGTSLGREQLIEAHRITDTDNVTGRVVIEPQGYVKIHLLISSEAIHPTPIQEVGGTAILRVITYVLHK